MDKGKRGKRIVFAGTYSEEILLGTGQLLDSKGEGIYVFEMDRESGKLTLLYKAIGEPNPTYVALDKSQRYLYSTNELKTFRGQKSGAVTSFKFDRETGRLSVMNRVLVGGTDAVHCALNNDSAYLLSANFMSGSVTVLPINKEDGTIESPSCFMQHYGTGPNPIRQTNAHAHCFMLDNEEKRAFIPDLGADKVFIYKVNWENGHLSENEIPYVSLAPGEGPRHCVFDKKGTHFYVINEMGNSIYVYDYDKESGNLTEKQRISTVPEDFKGESTCSAIKIHPDGKFLYGSNRGHDSLATYRIDEESGLLSLVSIQKTNGNTPRDFEFTPEGDYVVVGNQDSNSIVTFSVNKETGEIRETSRLDDIFTVTCVKIYDLEN